MLFLSAIHCWCLVFIISLAVSMVSFHHGFDRMHCLVLGAKISAASWITFVRYVAEASRFLGLHSRWRVLHTSLLISFFFLFCVIHTALTTKYIMARRALPSPGYPRWIWHIGAHQGDKPFLPCPIKRSTPAPPPNKVVKPSTNEQSPAPSQHRTTLPSPSSSFWPLSL
jgi:hypothetical protein